MGRDRPPRRTRGTSQHLGLCDGYQGCRSTTHRCRLAPLAHVDEAANGSRTASSSSSRTARTISCRARTLRIRASTSASCARECSGGSVRKSWPRSPVLGAARHVEGQQRPAILPCHSKQQRTRWLTLAVLEGGKPLLAGHAARFAEIELVRRVFDARGPLSRGPI